MNTISGTMLKEQIEVKVGKKVDLFGEFYDLDSMAEDAKDIEMGKLALKANSMLDFSSKSIKAIKEENMDNKGTAGWKRIGDNHLVIDNDGDVIKVFDTCNLMFDYLTVLMGRVANSMPLRPLNDDWHDDNVIQFVGNTYIHTDVPFSSSYNVVYNVCYIYDDNNNFVEAVAVKTK